MKMLKLFKLLFSLTLICCVILGVITGASFVVHKISQMGEIPEGKAGEIATWLLQWHGEVIALVDRFSA